MAPSYTNLSRTIICCCREGSHPVFEKMTNENFLKVKCRFFQGIYCKSPISPLPCLNVSAFPVTSIICRYKSLLMISIISMITQRGHSQQCPTKWGAPGAPPAGSSSPCRQVKYNTRKKMKPFSKKESVWQATGHTVYYYLNRGQSVRHTHASHHSSSCVLPVL